MVFFVGIGKGGQTTGREQRGIGQLCKTLENHNYQSNKEATTRSTERRLNRQVHRQFYRLQPQQMSSEYNDLL